MQTNKIPIQSKDRKTGLSKDLDLQTPVDAKEFKLAMRKAVSNLKSTVKDKEGRRLLGVKAGKRREKKERSQK